MDRVRIDMRELGTAGAPSASGAFVARGTEPLPLADVTQAPSVARNPKASRSWLSLGLRVLRNAAIAVAVMTLVPIGLVGVFGDRFTRVMFYTTNNRTRVAAAEPMRSLGLPRDPSITPMAAGLAFNALQAKRDAVPGFPVIEPVSRPEASWRTASPSPDMFPSARPDFYAGPSSQHVLEAAAKGFSPSEMAYLRALATSPVWHEFDLVARAPAVDIIGGQFKIPFGEGAFAAQRPITHFKETRELGYAAISRAAYYLALGQKDSAEAVLRSVVSFGFAMIDNSSSMIDELIGVVIVGNGRDALQRLYAIEHDPRASMPALHSPMNHVRGGNTSQALGRVSADEARRRLLAQIENPAVPLGDRFESLQILSATPCMNVRELMFGPRADVTDAIARARRTMARYPSERALVDLQTRMPLPPPGGPFQSLAVSSASVAGVVLHNPRLASCTLLLTGMSGSW